MSRTTECCTEMKTLSREEAWITMSGVTRLRSMIALTMATLTTAIMSTAGTTMTSAGTTRMAMSTTLRMLSTVAIPVVTTMIPHTTEEGMG